MLLVAAAAMITPDHRHIYTDKRLHMRDDLRPYWVKKCYLKFRYWYAEYFLRPECVYLGPYHSIM